MKILVDTNVLLRSVQPRHPACKVARKALVTLLSGKDSLHITPQNVAEFWNVCTRPAAVNGMGLDIDAVDRYADQLVKFFTVLADSLDVFEEWRRLVVAHRVVGAKVHDARLAATMKAYGVARIVTFNISDFARFAGLEAVHPERVLAERQG